MKYCSECAGSISRTMIIAEGRERYVCTACGAIHYQNPRVIVCCVVHCSDSVLMCRRAIEPAQGQWNLPSGFLECGETLEEGAARETFEETGVSVDPSALELYGVLNMTAIEQVAITFRVRIDSKPVLRVGPECEEVAFLTEDETHRRAIAWRDSFGNESPEFFRELRSGDFSIHLATLGGVSAAEFHTRKYPIFRAPGIAGSAR
jgi:ADP-ribose pyrophosphatase YjhB (NUDIX family)